MTSWSERIEAAARSGRFTASDIVEAWSPKLGPAAELGLEPCDSAFVRWLCEEVAWAVLGDQVSRARVRFEELRAIARARRQAA